MTAPLPAPCDTLIATCHREDGAAHAPMVLAATILASSLAFIDGSVVNVALPAIGRSVAAGAGDLQWVVNAYLLPLGALLLLGGGAGDRFGRRRLLTIGVTLFAIASAACAVAPSLAMLLAARVAQGVGAALLLPNSLAILGTAFAGEARGRAVGTWAAAGAVAGAIGPLIGGWLVDALSWRAIFLINLPIAAGAVALAWRYVGESRDEGGTRLDWAGGAVATLGLGALTWGLTRWSVGGGGAVTVAAGVVLLLGFVAIEARRGDAAMMPLALFGSRAFVGLTLLTLLLYGALGGLLILLPYLLIEQAGYSALAAGAALLPFPLVIGIASRGMGRLAARTGPRLPLTIGPMVAGLGFALAARIGSDASYWREVLPSVLVISLGMAGAVAPLTTAVLASVDARHTGTASGFNSAVSRAGGMIATALLGAVLTASGARLVGAFHVAAWIAAACAVAAGASALLLPRSRPARPVSAP